MVRFMSKEMKKDLKKSQCVNKVDEMMSSSSESEVEFSGDEAYDNGSNAFSFDPEYTETRLGKHRQILLPNQI